MQIMKQWIPGAAVLAALVAGSKSASADCNIRPYGDIGTTWTELGARFGPLGCPTTPEVPATDGHGGRMQTFQFGQITWSPDRGNHPILAAYQAGPNAIELMWFGVSPFNYDFWIVRIDSDGANVDQQDVKILRTQGHFVYRNALPGRTYSFVIEGCDEVDLEGRKARCRQGWLNRVAVTIHPHPHKGAPTLDDPPKRGTSCWISTQCVANTIKDSAAAVSAVASAIKGVGGK